MRLAIPALAVLTLSAATTLPEDERAQFRRPLTIPFPESAPYSPEVATLGKMLFFDPRLSGAQNMSCASCHNPSFGWETPVETAVGAANVPLGRHAQTTINAAWTAPLFWDGRAPDLEAQALGPMTAELEMNGDLDEIVARLESLEGYRTHFEAAFPGEGVTADTMVRAIATYERTIVAGWSPFDRWVEGDEEAISQSAKRGFRLFVGEARCSACHSGWNMSDNRFHDIGLDTEDMGRADIESGGEELQHAFKTPGLRNIAYRAPYMHAGQMPDLRAVILHYMSGGIDRPSRSSEMQAVSLEEQDVDDLLAFMATLSAPNSSVPSPVLPTN